MKQKRFPLCRFMLLPALGVMTLCQLAHAQVFTNHSTGELALGFRKTGTFQESFEVVANVGRATNFVSQALGTTVSVTGFSSSQLVTGSFSSFNNLSWSVFGDVHNANVSGYPSGTMWLTMPRATTGVQTGAPARESVGIQQVVVGKIESILNGAADISTRLGSSNTFNTVTYVREPLNTNSITQGENLGTYIGGSADSTQGTFQDNWYDADSSPINVENTTPGSFTAPLQSDLYEIRPTGNLDPHTTSTTGSAYYVGYFQLNTDGTMTFTRASSSINVPAPRLSITRSGNNSIISFASTNGATYTLFATNTAGITNPVSTWGVVGSTVAGNGGITNFVETTTATNRIYRVGGH